MKSKRVIIQERDRHLLRELSVMRVIDREQAKIVAGFRSTARVNARLLALTRAGFLNRYFIGVTGWKKSFYYLSPLGARIAGVTRHAPNRQKNAVLGGDFFASHRLAINEIYCKMKYDAIPVDGAKFVRWETFPLPGAAPQSLVPDGYVEVSTPRQTLAAFIEVDLGHEGVPVWKGKVQKYIEYALSGIFEYVFHKPAFRVLVIVNSDQRLAALRHVTASVIDKLFWFTTFDAIHQQGFWSPIWLRPSGDQKLSLL